MFKKHSHGVIIDYYSLKKLESVQRWSTLYKTLRFVYLICLSVKIDISIFPVVFFRRTTISTVFQINKQNKHPIEHNISILRTS